MVFDGLKKEQELADVIHFISNDRSTSTQPRAPETPNRVSLVQNLFSSNKVQEICTLDVVGDQGICKSIKELMGQTGRKRTHPTIKLTDHLGGPCELSPGQAGENGRTADYTIAHGAIYYSTNINH
ncbi:hypothetical protein M3Y95_00792800 [Aphelenchoides besseyi]|nr:hypothetical protein M3Y95_00792800 [Aphelenchoides besseyi]